MVDDRALRPVERTDEILPFRKIDARLAADRRIHLSDERRRHGDPGNAAKVRGGDETGDVGGRAAPDRHERASTLEAYFAPQPGAHAERLRLLAGGNGMQRSIEQRRVEPPDALVDDDLDLLGNEVAQPRVRTSLDEQPRSREHDAVRVFRPPVRGRVVQRPALFVEAAKLALALGERPPLGATRSPPRLLDVHLHQHREGLLAQLRRGRFETIAPPPREITAGGAESSASRASCSSMARNSTSPRVAKIVEIGAAA